MLILFAYHNACHFLLLLFIHDPSFPDLNRITNVTGLFSPNMLAVRVTYLFMLIENVGFEPRLCVPSAVCSNINEIDVLHHILIKLLQRELNPYLRSDSPPYYRYTMEPYLIRAG